MVFKRLQFALGQVGGVGEGTHRAPLDATVQIGVLLPASFTSCPHTTILELPLPPSSMESCTFYVSLALLHWKTSSPHWCRPVNNTAAPSTGWLFGTGWAVFPGQARTLWGDGFPPGLRMEYYLPCPLDNHSGHRLLLPSWDSAEFSPAFLSSLCSANMLCVRVDLIEGRRFGGCLPV